MQLCPFLASASRFHTHVQEIFGQAEPVFRRRLKRPDQIPDDFESRLAYCRGVTG